MRQCSRRDLERALPNHREIPLKSMALSTTNRPCLLLLQGLNQVPLQGWPSTPSEGSSGWTAGMRRSGENGQSQSSDRYSQELTLWAQFLHLLISKKALKSFLVTSAPQDKQKSSAKKNNICLTACTYPSPKSHICWPSLPSSCLFGAVSQSHVRCCLPNYSPCFAPIKLNSRLSHYDFFSPQLTAFCPPEVRRTQTVCWASLQLLHGQDWTFFQKHSRSLPRPWNPRTAISSGNTALGFSPCTQPSLPRCKEALCRLFPGPTRSPFRIMTGATAAGTEWGLQTLLWTVSVPPRHTHTQYVLTPALQNVTSLGSNRVTANRVTSVM